MTPYNENPLLASFKSMNIGTHLCDSSNEVSIYPPYTMGHDQSTQLFDGFKFK